MVSVSWPVKSQSWQLLKVPLSCLFTSETCNHADAAAWQPHFVVHVWLVECPPFPFPFSFSFSFSFLGIDGPFTCLFHLCYMMFTIILRRPGNRGKWIGMVVHDNIMWKTGVMGDYCADTRILVCQGHLWLAPYVREVQKNQAAKAMSTWIANVHGSPSQERRWPHKPLKLIQVCAFDYKPVPFDLSLLQVCFSSCTLHFWDCGDRPQNYEVGIQGCSV